MRYSQADLDDDYADAHPAPICADCHDAEAENEHHGTWRCDGCWAAFQAADPDWMFRGRAAVKAAEDMGPWGEW